EKVPETGLEPARGLPSPGPQPGGCSTRSCRSHVGIVLQASRKSSLTPRKCSWLHCRHVGLEGQYRYQIVTKNAFAAPQYCPGGERPTHSPSSTSKRGSRM